MLKTKIVLLTLFIILGTVAENRAQTTISGTISSLNGEKIPDIVIVANASGETTIYNQPDEIVPEIDGKYELQFYEPGIYNLQISAVHHQNLSIPVMIFDQDRIELDIRLVPRYYNNGAHFDKESYREWIRVYGNFNNYDFNTGYYFDLDQDGSISAMIPAEHDTVTYQIRGISSGPVPLPDEPLTQIRPNNTFEGVMIPAADADSIELRFDPNIKTLFHKDIGPISINSNQRPRARLSFSNPTDHLWIEPLSLTHLNFISYEIDGLEAVSINEESEETMDDFFRNMMNSAESYRERYRSYLNDNTLHPQQRAAIYVAYMGILNQQLHWNNHIQENTIERPELEFIVDLIEEVHPLHPMWGRNPRAAVHLLKFSDFDPDVVQYSQKMIKEHPDGMVVRNLVLELIKEHAHLYNSPQEMPEYAWIVERYGENQLARLAVTTFARSNQE